METSNPSQISSNHFLKTLGLSEGRFHYNLSPEALEDITIKEGLGLISASGALAVNTGEFTGRSPKDRFIVQDEITEDTVDWGEVNIPISSENYHKLHKRILSHLEANEFYIRDGIAGADPANQMNVRFVNEHPWQNQFVYNMFLRPSEDELVNFEPEWTVIAVPSVTSEGESDGTRQHNFSIINFTEKTIIIGGTAYTGEIKKGIFSVLNFTLPKYKDILSMHCSANVGSQGDTAVFFGLSGTGKTTLSTDPHRFLIGDDEHGWSEDKVFNFEGGCYAKTIDLSSEKEPEIYKAIRKGAILENIVFEENTNRPDFTDSTITQNTRVSYPIFHIDKIQKPSYGEIPKNIFFLTCDAFGVLAPISKLSSGQAKYHFISGYTAKVAGTEEGVTEPKTTFSACFGAPFLPLHPTKYADMLGEKIERNEVNVWLVNTGWSGGRYGVGKRMSLKYTRAMINAALRGDLDTVEYTKDRFFGLMSPTSCPDVPSDLLDARSTWTDKEDFDETATKLVMRFNSNFDKYRAKATAEIINGGPLQLEKLGV